MTRRLFVLRPEPGASQTAAAAASLDIDAVALPLFEVVATPWTAPDPAEFDALILTSANAVRMGGPQLAMLLDLPVLAVGDATASIARAAGFRVARVGGTDGAALVEDARNLRLLHLTGVDHRALDGVRSVAIYEAKRLPIPDAFRELEGQVAAVHSARAAARLREGAETLGLSIGTIAVAAISARCAGALGDGWGDVAVAAHPTDTALLEQAARLCQTRQP